MARPNFVRVERARPGRSETAHEVYDAGLKLGAELHRFLAYDDTPHQQPGVRECCAIYLDGREIGRYARTMEADVIMSWNDWAWKQYADGEAGEPPCRP